MNQCDSVLEVSHMLYGRLPYKIATKAVVYKKKVKVKFSLC
jgi:hypothetical protein